MKITILNTAVLIAFGTFEFRRISLSKARKIAKNFGVESAIGHASTAAIISELLDIKVETNRIEYNQPVGETELIFRLKSHIPERKILTRGEIEEIGYDFGLLKRLK